MLDLLGGASQPGLHDTAATVNVRVQGQTPPQSRMACCFCTHSIQVLHSTCTAPHMHMLAKQLAGNIETCVVHCRHGLRHTLVRIAGPRKAAATHDTVAPSRMYRTPVTAIASAPTSKLVEWL